MMGGKKVSSPNQQKRASIIVTEDEWEPGILEISAYTEYLGQKFIKPFVL